MSRVYDLLVRARGETGDAEASMRKLQGSMRDTGRAMVGAGQKLTRSVTLPLVAIGAASVKAFSDFDGAMTQSIAIMGDVDSTMRTKMEKTAREVAKTTTVSASQAAEGYFFLASAGMDAAQAIEALPQVAAFAQAGMFDMATATDLATDAQSALGLASKDPIKGLENLTRVTDVFVRANTLANTSVEQIAEAMTNKAGAALRALGKDIEEGSAVLAAFADQGLKGAAAGEALNIVSRDLQTAAMKNKDAFKAANIAVFDASGKMRNYAHIIGDLETHLAGMSDEQRKAALATLGFQDRSQSALITLLGTSDAIARYEGELRKAGGTTKEVAEKQLEAFSGQMSLAKSELVDAGITIGTILAPALVSLATSLSGAASWFAQLDAGLQTTVVVVGVVAAAIGPLLLIVGKLTMAAAALVPVFAAITLPVAGVVLGVAALAAGLVIAYRRSETFRNIVNRAFKSVGESVTAVLTSLRETLGAWVSFARSMWQRFGDDAMRIVGPYLRAVVGVVSAQMENLRDAVLIVLAVLRGDWSEVWDLLKGIVRRTLNAVLGLVKGFASSLGQLVSSFYNQGKRLGKAIVDGIKDGVRDNAASIAGFVARHAGGAAGAGVDAAIQAAARSKKGGKNGPSLGGFQGMGFDALGNINDRTILTGQQALSGSRRFSSLGSSDAFSVSTDAAGVASVSENTGVTAFLRARKAMNEKLLKAANARRSTLVGQLRTAKTQLVRANRALGVARRSGTKAAIGKAQDAVAKARDRVGMLEGEIEGLEQEIVSLGGQINADVEALTPPDVSGQNADAQSAADDRAAQDARTAENFRRRALGLQSIEEEAELAAANEIRAQYGLPPVRSMSEIGSNPTTVNPPPSSAVQGSNLQPLLATSQSALAAIAATVARAMSGTGGTTFNISSPDADAVANRVMFVLGNRMVRAGGSV